MATSSSSIHINCEDLSHCRNKRTSAKRGITPPFSPTCTAFKKMTVFFSHISEGSCNFIKYRGPRSVF